MKHWESELATLVLVALIIAAIAGIILAELPKG